jgi:hypothetical protein
MKLFQQLLLAPAALGLLAPVAATAAEVNINDVASYARKPVSQMRAAKASQFSDVVPGDWAYTALQNLSESYGCVDNSYTQNLKSGQALTRYEAAALVNACLDGGVASAEINADAARLTNEFGTEMAILKGRSNGLEYKVQELSDGQFSAATKLNNEVVFNLGYVTDELADTGNAVNQKVNSTYVFQSNLTTSFNGQDKLFTRFETGNVTATDPFGVQGLGTNLEASNSSGNTVTLDKLWYSRPVGDSFTVWAGPRIMSETMLASSPSIYKNITAQFDNGGNGSAYGSVTAPGFGIAWTQQKDNSSDARFEVSSNYIAVNGASSTGGVLTDDQAKWLSKIGYGSDRWQVSLALSKNMCLDPDKATTNENETCTNFGADYGTAGAINLTGPQTSYALRGHWKPESSGIIPAVQVGYDWSTIDDDATNATTAALGSVEATQAFMVGFVWEDAFVDGNTAGIAFGHPEHATDYVDVNFPNNDPANKAFAWEAYYDYRVNDGITITPAIFANKDRQNGNAGTNDNFGGLIQTTFKF